MEYVSLAINVLFLVFLALGFLTGFIRGLKKTLIRSVWIAVIVASLIILSMSVTSLIMNVEINYIYQGVPCSNLKDFLVNVLYGSLGIDGANYEGLAEIGIFLISMIANGIVFVVLYFLVKLVSLPIYWIFNRIIFAKERRKKKEARRNKEKYKIKKHRLAGALAGAVLGFVSFLMTITPVMGYVNLAKVVEKETSDSEGTGVLTQGVGDMYTEFMEAYDSAIPMTVLSKTGIDKLVVGIFNGLTSGTINNKKVVLADEAVYFSKIYNKAMALNAPDMNTITKAEFNDVLTGCEDLINTIFDSQFISATSDIVIPFGVQYIRQTMSFESEKQYVQRFYNVVFDEMEKLNSASVRHEIVGILDFVKTLNNNNLLLPIIQTPDALNATYLQENLTKESADQIVSKLFAINTVNNIAPALVNFLLGFGAEQLEFDYSGDSTVVTSASLKQGATTIIKSVVDLLGTYSEENSTKFEIGETAINSFGTILDEMKSILSESNFKSIINAIEPKLESVLVGSLEGQPQFLINAVKEIIGNISDVNSFKAELSQAYDAIKMVEKQFKDSKVDDNYDVQYINFIKIGEALDEIQESALFKNNLLLRTMDEAIQYYGSEFEKSLSTENNTVRLGVINKISDNLQELVAGDGVEWHSELPKYKNTIGIFLNLFQTKDSVIDKLKSDSDSTLEEFGKELDGDLNSSALFKGTDRLLVSDMLNIVESMINPDGNEALETLLDDAKNNIEDSRITLVWEDELFHIKQLLKVDLSDSSDNGLISIGDTIDKVVFDYHNGIRNIPKSKIFTQDVICNFISDYMDNVFEGVTSESDFYTTITSIKTAFNTKTITSYKTEIEALVKLKEVKTLVESQGFNFNSGIPRGGIALGRKLDEAISKGGVVVDKSLINNFVTQKLDDYFASYTDMSSELTQIKSGFNNTIEKYEVEFTALLRLMDVADVAGESGFDFNDKAKASSLGASIDIALGVVTVNETGYSSKIVNRSLVNGYIKRYIADNVTIDQNSQFGDVLNNITGAPITGGFGTGRIDTMENTYAREFGLLSQLLIVSEEFTDITLSTINNINATLNSTLLDQFDGNDGSNGRAVVSDPLRNSYLVGDSLLVAVDGILEDYIDNPSNVSYSEILVEVYNNYSYETYGIRDNILWMGNTEGTLSYTDLINAFVDLDEVLNGSLTASIAQPSDFTSELAAQYDDIIYELQGDGVNIGNILLDANGVNKLAKFVLNKIKTLLLTQEALFGEEIEYINTFINFLDGYRIYTQDSILENKYYYLPYGVESNYYAYLQIEEYDVWAIEETNSHSGIKINKPFTHISELINNV